MKILFLDQFSELGGAQLCLLDLVPGLLRRGWEAVVAAPGEGPLFGRLAEWGVTTHRLPLKGYSQGRKNAGDAARFFLDVPPVAAEVRRLARGAGAQLIYVNGPRLLPAVALARVRTPVVFHSHNWIEGALSRAMARVALGAVEAKVVAASRFVARQWPSAEIVFGGVEGPREEPPARSAHVRPRVGMIGRIMPQKRQLEFARAARSVDADFVLCGDVTFGGPPVERYKQTVLDAAPANFTWLGWRDSVYDVLRSLDLLVVPSSLEGGVPRVVLEAFSCGVPVLACDSGATTEAVQPGVTGFLLASAHPGEIARRVRELLAQPERRAAVAARARVLWREHFTVERFRERVMDLLLRFTRGTPAPETAVPPAPCQIPTHTRSLPTLK